MTRRFRVSIQVAGVLLLLGIVFPPWRTYAIDLGSSSPHSSGPVLWGPLWRPRWSEGAIFWLPTGVAWDRLLLEFLAVVIIGVVVFVSLKEKRP